ncbi:UNVERIFIED_CONTAM: hypothetical protein NCL1_44491 [Trichonephila clavipes]
MRKFRLDYGASETGHTIVWLYYTVDEISSDAADCRLTYTMCELLSKAVKQRHWAERVCQSEHLQVCEETRGEDDWRIMRQWCSNELRMKDRLIWAHQ